ncbi:MAG: zinc-dependent alcohol dehydrogenase family protein [Candidatus Latescibacteria bacterium]|nr:zinc-dependent alcohol dehydrogenase family protein [Candidatus Latescibacterota bacterium]
MKAMVLAGQAPIGGSPLKLRDVPAPEPGPGEVRVRVRACGLCRTDLHVIEGDLPPRRLPLIPGHQIVGVVDRIGPSAQRFKEGDRIGIAWLRHTCGECRYCRAGLENLCEGARFTGYHEDGGYADQATVPEAYAYKIPEIFTDTEATPLLCAGIIGYRALERTDVPRGGKLGIWGFGSSAHVTIQVALARGCTVFVATRGEKHQALAREMGAKWVGPAAEPFPERVDGGILFAPVGDLVPVALRSIEKGGTLAIAGIHLSRIPSIDYERELFYERNLRSVTANTRADGEELLREAAAIPLRPRVTPFPLEDANRGLQLLKSDQLSGTGVLAL